MEIARNAEGGRCEQPAEGMPARQGCQEQCSSIVLCVDDTDDETRSTSTGKVAALIAQAVVRSGGRIRLGITRHQLLLRSDVPYTSHNSSMAFEAQIPVGAIDKLREEAIAVLAAECVPTADPGLALAVLPEAGFVGGKGEQQLEGLIAFGKRAKVEYCRKEDAYALAQSIPWVFLSEHGGTGQGVVGALAGIGLRLSGSDGRFRGKQRIDQLLGEDGGADARGGKAGRGGGGHRQGAGGGRRDDAPRRSSDPVEGQGVGAGPRFVSVGRIVERLSACKNGPVRVVDATGAVLGDDVPVRVDVVAKSIYLGGSFTIVCSVEDGIATPLEKDQLADGAGEGLLSHVCSSFEWDNDAEECTSRTESCRNCLHRRWESWGFSCMGDGRRP